MAVVFDTHPVQYLKLGVGWTRHSHVNSRQVTDEKEKSDRLPSHSNYKLEKNWATWNKMWDVWLHIGYIGMSIEFSYTADAGKETEDRFNRLIKRLQKLFSYIECFHFWLQYLQEKLSFWDHQVFLLLIIIIFELLLNQEVPLRSKISFAKETWPRQHEHKVPTIHTWEAEKQLKRGNLFHY